MAFSQGSSDICFSLQRAARLAEQSKSFIEVGKSDDARIPSGAFYDQRRQRADHW